jgi:hypothetical protein
MNELPQTPQSNIGAVMHRFCKHSIFFSWTDFALCFRIYKQSPFADYHIGIDFQIAWVNIWLQFVKKQRC